MKVNDSNKENAHITRLIKTGENTFSTLKADFSSVLFQRTASSSDRLTSASWSTRSGSSKFLDKEKHANKVTNTNKEEIIIIKL